MTVAAIAQRKSVFTGSGTTGPFSFTWPIINKSYILVTKYASDGTPTVLTEGAGANQYSITLSATGASTTITTVTAVASGERLLIEGNTPISQPDSYRNQSDFQGYRHEASFDRVTMIIQERLGYLSRTIIIPSLDETGTNTELPIASLRANKALVFDADGNVDVSDDDYNDQADSVAANALLASQWASLTSGIVDGTDYSSKEYAVGVQRRGVADGGSAKDWASYIGGTVDDTNYSAKDRAIAAASSAAAASTSESNASSSESAAAAYANQAASAAAEGLYNHVVTIDDTDSPFTPLLSEEGWLFRCDCTNGNIVIDLDELSSYGEDMKFAFVKTDGSANTVTINAGGADTIDDGTDHVISERFVVTAFIGDSATDQWLSVIQSQSIADGSITYVKAAPNQFATYAQGALADTAIQPANKLTTKVYFTAGGTFNVPAGITSARVRLIGPGGGGSAELSGGNAGNVTCTDGTTALTAGGGNAGVPAFSSDVSAPALGTATGGDLNIPGGGSQGGVGGGCISGGEYDHGGNGTPGGLVEHTYTGLTGGSSTLTITVGAAGTAGTGGGNATAGTAGWAEVEY